MEDPKTCKHPKDQLEFVAPKLPKRCKLCGRFIRVKKK